MTISEDNIRREEGETIHITCSATSYPMPTILWMKDHALMENTSAAERFVVTVVEDDKSNVVMSTLTLRAITFEDRGAYTCNATTSHNSGNKEYELRIIGMYLCFYIPGSTTRDLSYNKSGAYLIH